MDTHDRLYAAVLVALFMVVFGMGFIAGAEWKKSETDDALLMLAECNESNWRALRDARIYLGQVAALREREHELVRQLFVDTEPDWIDTLTGDGAFGQVEITRTEPLARLAGTAISLPEHSMIPTRRE